MIGGNKAFAPKAGSLEPFGRTDRRGLTIRKAVIGGLGQRARNAPGPMHTGKRDIYKLGV
jgi:hypothetical protein